MSPPGRTRDARPRVRRRCHLVPRGRRLLLRVLRQPSLSSGRRGLRGASNHSGAGGAERASLRRRGGHAGRRDRDLRARASRRRRGPRTSSSRWLPTGRRSRASSSRVTTSSWRRASIRPADGSPGSPGQIRECRGTGRSCGWASRCPRRRAARRRWRRRVGHRSAVVAGGRSPLLLRPLGLVEPLPGGRHGSDVARAREARLRVVGVRDAVYAFLDDGGIACNVTRNGVGSLELVDSETGALESARLESTACSVTAFAAGGGRVIFGAASPTRPPSIVAFEPNRPRGDPAPLARHRPRSGVDLGSAGDRVPHRRRCGCARVLLPAAECGVGGACRRTPTAAGDLSRRSDRTLRAGARARDPVLRSARDRRRRCQLRGDTGYGREYRRLLNGRWGEIDWRTASPRLARQ